MQARCEQLSGMQGRDGQGAWPTQGKNTQHHNSGHDNYVNTSI